MLKTFASITLVASAFILASPSQAAAAPSSCRSWKIYDSGNGEGGAAECNGGTGHFRARIYCTADPSNGWGTFYHGTWKLAGRDERSSRYCPDSQPYVVSAGYQTANW